MEENKDYHAYRYGDHLTPGSELKIEHSVGTHVMLVFLALNGYELSYTQKELSDAILDLASGKTGAEDILRWIISHQK